MRYALVILLTILGSSTGYAQTSTRIARPGCIGSNCAITETNRPGAYLRRPATNLPKRSDQTKGRCYVDSHGTRVCK
ncbi:hypothetical protein EV561_105128 [Rhizobium sp. BK376]|jgi:hypothetical protein|nr:hypothetical protein EV561_105128 [Rhizobium sp. BK376]